MCTAGFLQECSIRERCFRSSYTRDSLRSTSKAKVHVGESSVSDDGVRRAKLEPMLQEASVRACDLSRITGGHFSNAKSNSAVETMNLQSLKGVERNTRHGAKSTKPQRSSPKAGRKLVRAVVFTY